MLGVKSGPRKSIGLSPLVTDWYVESWFSSRTGTGAANIESDYPDVYTSIERHQSIEYTLDDGFTKLLIKARAMAVTRGSAERSPQASESRQTALHRPGKQNVSYSVPFNIRQLGPEHVGLMEALLVTFGEVFDELETYCAARPGRAYLRDLLGSDHFIALAALKNDSVVGGLAAYDLQKFEQERSEIYIYDLAVGAAHRRQGIATALIREVKKIAAARAAHVVFVQADAGDLPAIALYTRLGTSENVLHFDIDVEIDDSDS